MFQHKLIRGVLCSVICLLAARSVSAETTSLPFLKDGTPQFQVKVLSDKPSLTFAKEQITQILPQLSGTNTTPTASAWTLNLDIANPALKSQNLTQEKLGDDGYLITKDANGILITGYTGRAVLYGVFELIHQATGFTWMRPLIGSTPVSPILNATINMPLPYTGQPAFNERGLTTSYTYWKTDNLPILNWLIHNGLNMNALNTANFVSGAAAREERGMPLHIHGHAFGFLVPPGEYGKTHPEYFSLIDGKRKISSRNSQLCLSNPAVVALIVQKFNKMLAEQPSLQEVGLGPNDGTSGWCQCDKCAAMDSPKDMHQPFIHGERSYSTRYIKFANEVARELKKQHPNIRIHVYAYSNYIAPPDCEVDPALDVEFCTMYRCTVHALNDPNCPRNAAFNRYLQGWMAKTHHIFIRDYYLMVGSGSARAMPTSLYTLQKDLQYYHSQHLLGMVPEMVADGPNGANVPAGTEYPSWLRPPSYYTDAWNTGWPVYYGMAQLLWNPDKNVQQIIKEACDTYYGPAADLMTQYHDTLQKNWYLSGHVGEAPPPSKITTFSENVQSGPYCLCWGYAPRITWQANHLLNVQPDGKTTKATLIQLAQLLLDAREIARKKMLPAVQDRIETDVQNFQTMALSQGYEIDFRQGQTKVSFMSTTHE